MNIAELFLLLGIKADIAAIRKIYSTVTELKGGLKGVAQAATLAIYGIDKFTSQTIRATAEIQNLNAQTGLSIEKLQAYGKAASIINPVISIEKAQNSIANLQRNIDAIKMGEGNISPFQLLGIETRGKDAFQVIDEIRQATKGMPNGIATNLISQTGLDPAFYKVLKASREEFDRLSKNNFLSRKQREDVMQLSKAINELKINMVSLKDNAVATIAQPLTNLIVGFTEMKKAISDSKSAITILTGAGVLLTRAWLPFILGVGTIAIALEDMATFFAGGESFTGKIFTPGRKKAYQEKQEEIYNRAYTDYGGKRTREKEASDKFMSMTNNFSINSTDPKGAATEVSNHLERMEAKYRSEPF
jgi:hypothetical protein